MMEFKQKLNTRVIGTVNQVFAEVTFDVALETGEILRLTLDMESSLDILYQMDHGKVKVREIDTKRQQPRSKRSSWLDIFR